MGIQILNTSLVVPNSTILRGVGQDTAATATSLAIRGGKEIGQIQNILTGILVVDTGNQNIVYPSGSIFFGGTGTGLITSTAVSALQGNTSTIPSDGGNEYYIGESADSISAVTVNGNPVTGSTIIGNDRNFIRLAANATAGNVVVTYVSSFAKFIRIPFSGSPANYAIGQSLHQDIASANTTLHTHTVTSAVASYPLQLAYEGADAIHLSGTNVEQIFI